MISRQARNQRVHEIATRAKRRMGRRCAHCEDARRAIAAHARWQQPRLSRHATPSVGRDHPEAGALGSRCASRRSSQSAVLRISRRAFQDALAHHRVRSSSALTVNFELRPDVCAAATSSIRRWREARMAAVCCCLPGSGTLRTALAVGWARRGTSVSPVRGVRHRALVSANYFPQFWRMNKGLSGDNTPFA